RWSRSKKRIYYFSPDTKQSHWEKPEGDVKIIPLDLSLVPVGDDEASTAQNQIRASHLLVKHSGSRRPSSWKEANISRSKEEAMQIIQNFRAKIESGEVDLSTLAKTESDCSSASRGGDLGKFGYGQMQASFEQAAFALKVGELSNPVVSDSGIHLILRTE
ncbi:hypothetical protein BATDEDRAFT_10474, partial [Batrachochytrium dendrobatidis JAM81]